MSSENIEQNNKKERKKFTARFEGYGSKDGLQILFSEVRDEKGELMHMRYWINGYEAKELLGGLSIGDKVEFEADLENVYEEEEVVDYMVINPRNIKKAEKEND